MGLDMYLVKLTKVDDEELSRKNAEELTCSWFIRNAENEKLLQYVKPWLRESEISVPEWDEEKIRRDFRVADDSEWCAMWESETEHGFGYTGGEEVVIRKEDRADFTIRKQQKVYLVNIEPAGYWRKDYFLSSAIAEAFFYGKTKDGKKDCIVVENTGYYPLTDKVRDVIREYAEPLRPGSYGHGHEHLETDSEDSVICYYEWY